MSLAQEARRVRQARREPRSTSRPTKSCSRRRRPDSGVLVKIVKGDGGTVVGNEIIATIDTEAKTATARRHAAAAPAPAASAGACAPRQGSGAGRHAGSAASIAAENKIDPRRVQRQRPRRPRHQGRRARCNPQAPAAKAPAAPTAPAARRASGARLAVDLGALGERPEQRVPMSRLRARIAERLVQSQSTAAILTTFNEVNMQPVMELRNRYKEKFEKEHGVKLGFMSFFVKAAVHRAQALPGCQRVDRRQRHHLSRLFRHRHRRGQSARAGGAHHPRRGPAVARGDREASRTSASARRTASSRSRS